MGNTAILIGNSVYKRLAHLECCRADVAAMQDLLARTGKFEQIEVLENLDSDPLKLKIREIVENNISAEEIFFYFSGHGCQCDSDFYYCTPNFDVRKPNETGISNTELHTLLRIANANLVVKIVDACNSGTVLVKKESMLFPDNKSSFNNLIQISSCLDSQNSLAGDPLSLFTEKFRTAALRKNEGPVYYTDIIFSLRDEFLEDESQTPFFVSQGTGREKFVENAAVFDGLRAELENSNDLSDEAITEIREEPSFEQNLLNLLEEAEAAAANSEKIEKFISQIFDGLTENISKEDFSKFYELDVQVHSHYADTSARTFMIQVLSQEPRNDDMVTASIKREYKKNKISQFASIISSYMDEDNYKITHELYLNCSLRRAQLVFSLKPKFYLLKKISLVVNAAPSLENCYLFEVGSQYLMQDFNKYSSEGSEFVRRWYKRSWDDQCEEVVDKITGKLKEFVKNSIAGAYERLKRTS